MSQDLILSLQAQFDAAKQMHNETLNQNLLFRANQILFQNQIKFLTDQLQAKDKEIDDLKKQLENANKPFES
jgi:hypothetical protein